MLGGILVMLGVYEIMICNSPVEVSLGNWIN
jgi:hypothetical protein